MRKFVPIILLPLLIANFNDLAGQTPLKMRDSTIKGSQTFAMIVGISKYKYVRPLTYADKDAELFRDYLKSPGGGSVKDENIFCLLNEKATNSNFWSKGFQWIKSKELQKGDKLFIYLAGHGDAIDEDQFFFLGYDCNPGGDKNNYLVSGAIQLFNLKKKIAEETSKGVDVVFIMDACRSDELPGGLPGQNFLNTAISEKKVGEIIMLATGAGQESLEDASIGNGHGLFTYYLVDGLTGAADSIGIRDNKITFQEIRSYVDKYVPLVAEQRFKRQQVPYFCCNEYGDKIVSVVDTAYLQKWLKTKRQSQKGPGNSFYGSIDRLPDLNADTTLIQVYNLFYKAINNNDLTGRSSAEYYYQQMDKKFPGNPYTLDAKSTLAAEYINYAQNKVNSYIDCGETASAKDKQNDFEAGVRLEKAISLLKEDEPDFASSLRNRMYFLKASGSNESTIAFQNAYAALSINPNGAYILNQLALLHLSNKNIDSAVYYSSKAVKVAPKWACALTTLKLAEQTRNSNNENKTNPKKKGSSKINTGLMIGGGISMPKITFSKEKWRQGNIDYNDSLNNITTTSGGIFDIGITSYIGISKMIAIRPAIQLIYEAGALVYDRKSTTGGPPYSQRKRTENIAINIPVPFIIRFSQKTVDPFISLGPTVSFSLKQSNGGTPTEQRDIPMKSFDLLGEGGIGIDISLKKTSIILSPELRYSHGFTNIKGTGNSLYLNTITSLKKSAFTFSLYLRRK